MMCNQKLGDRLTISIYCVGDFDHPLSELFIRINPTSGKLSIKYSKRFVPTCFSQYRPSSGEQSIHPGRQRSLYQSFLYFFVIKYLWKQRFVLYCQNPKVIISFKHLFTYRATRYTICNNAGIIVCVFSHYIVTPMTMTFFNWKSQ